MSQLFKFKGRGSVLAWRNGGAWSKDDLPAWIKDGRKVSSYGDTAYVYASNGDLTVVCHPGQWVVLDEWGKLLVMPDGEFAERYEQG